MQKRALLLGLTALLVSAPPGSAQLMQGECVDGSVTHDGETYSCSEVDLLARVSLEEMNADRGNDAWGWTDLLTGREYALMGLDTGTFFVDVTDPLTPRLLGQLPTTTENSTWRDMKVYQDHMFVVSEAPGHGLQIFDLTQLRGLAADPTRTFAADLVFTGGAGPTFFRAHNVAINEDTGHAYVVGARNQQERVCDGGLYMINITDPTNPQFAGCFSQDGYTHDVQCVVYDGPDVQHAGKEICFASNENTVTIVDVTDKSAPGMISHALYPQTGYTHQGWLSEDHRYFFVNDEFDEVHYGLPTRTIVLDVTSLSTPSYIGSYFHPTTSITHNLFVRGNHLFAANYTTGLRILDISGLLTLGSVEAITTKGYFDTHPPHNDPVFQGAWSNYPFFASGTVLVSDMNRGLFVLRPTNLDTATEPDHPGIAANLDVYPNPFAERFTVSLSLEREQRVRGEVFDMLGRRVAEVFDRRLMAGFSHDLSLSLEGVPSGLYILRVSGEHFVLSRRLTVAR